MYNLHYDNKSHIPNNPLREDILEAAKDYIGLVYANDRIERNLAIDRKSLSVELRHPNAPKESYRDMVYYDAINIAQIGDNPLVLEPDELAIDAITLDFFPISSLDNFRRTAREAITEFVHQRGIIQDAVISFPIDTFDVSVYVPSELETIDTTEMPDEELLTYDDLGAEVIEVPLKHYVRMRGNKISINEFQLFKIAISNYYPG